jgi:hypothetical protein
MPDQGQPPNRTADDVTRAAERAQRTWEELYRLYRSLERSRSLKSVRGQAERTAEAFDLMRWPYCMLGPLLRLIWRSADDEYPE